MRLYLFRKNSKPELLTTDAGSSKHVLPTIFTTLSELGSAHPSKGALWSKWGKAPTLTTALDTFNFPAGGVGMSKTDFRQSST